MNDDSGSQQIIDILIIGAGLAGLAAASDLKSQGRNVIVVDKGRGPGGRLASRHIANASFDNGAQFMTTRHPRFLSQVQQWIEAGVAEKWYSSFPGHPNSHARYRGVPTMTAIAKNLAVGLDVRCSNQVTSISSDESFWFTLLENGDTIKSRALIVTSPVPQTKTLLAAGNIQLSSHNQQRLDRITYESCLSVMAILDVPSALNPPGALMLTEGPIAWISDNQQKGVSAIPAVTIHASGDFSSRYFNEDSNAVGELLIEAAKPFLKAEVEEFQVHGWRYSKPVNIDTKPCMVANEDTDLPPIILAGDAFDGPRVEGAVLSGWAAAEALLCYI